MTENERFILTEQFNGLQGVAFVKDDCADVDTYYTVDGAVDLLNELWEENEQLKQDKTNLHRTMSRDRVRYLQFRDKVFDLIDEKIQYYEHKPFSASISNPMSVNFDEDVDRLARLSELEQLKKELEL